MNLDPEIAFGIVNEIKKNLLRICITGGEPLLHPQIESFIQWPEGIPDIAYVLTTNLTARQELDSSLCALGWQVAISLNGAELAHSNYTGSKTFKKTVNRIEYLAKHTIVYIYCVLNDYMSFEDIDFLFELRDQIGVKFLRFQTPRPFGRFTKLKNTKLIDAVRERLDAFSGLKTLPSNTYFLTVNGEMRISH